MLEEIALVDGTQVSAVLARAALKRIREGVGLASPAGLPDCRSSRFSNF
jgi:hypothetical protein